MLTAYAMRDEQHPGGHGRGADLHAHAGHDGADGGHDRRALRRAPDARPRRLPPAGGRGLARTDDRPPGARDARVRGDRARDPARRGSAGGREVADGLSPLRPRPAPAAADLHRRALPRDAAPRRRGRRRGAAVAVLPRLHPRRGDPRGDSGPRTRGQDAGGLRRRAGGADRAGRRTPRTPYAAMRSDLLPYFGLPFYRAMLERSGFGAEIEAFDAAAGRRREDAGGDLRALPRRSSPRSATPPR